MAEAKGHFLSREQENRAYISEKVNPLIENMLMDLLKEKPLNSVIFSDYLLRNLIIAWIYDKMASKWRKYFYFDEI